MSSKTKTVSGNLGVLVSEPPQWKEQLWYLYRGLSCLTMALWSAKTLMPLRKVRDVGIHNKLYIAFAILEVFQVSESVHGVRTVESFGIVQGSFRSRSGIVRRSFGSGSWIVRKFDFFFEKMIVFFPKMLTARSAD